MHTEFWSKTYRRAATAGWGIFERRVDGTGSGPCPVSGVGFNGVEPSGSPITVVGYFFNDAVSSTECSYSIE
jgi:hypothetical protein